MMFKRRHFVYIAGAAGAASLGVIAAIPNGPGMLKSTGADLLQVMQARSPGERANGAVTTKGKRQQVAAAALPAAAPAPTHKVLPAAVAAPVAAAAPVPAAVAAPLPLATPVLAAAPLVAAPPVLAGGIPPAAGLIGLVPAIPLLAGGGGGGTTVLAQPPAVTPPVTPPPPAPAVPEPATWLMMILGFGMLGSVLRSRRNATKGRAVQAAAIS